MRILLWILLGSVALACGFLALGYHRLPKRPTGIDSFALPPEETSFLARKTRALLADQPGLSGFRLVSDGIEAFVLRALSARMAKHSLDVQYYIWHADLTGMLLLHELLQAADRGVRVRLLLDDLDARAKNFALAAIDAHPNIEVRIFNPFASRQSLAGKALEGITNFSRINHRMHNKAWIADGSVAIAGGRNIGDEYFAANPKLNFIDLDLVAVGPAVGELSTAFDTYWNSQVVYPMQSLNSGQVDQAHLDRLRAHGREQLERAQQSEYVRAARSNEVLEQLVENHKKFVFTDAFAVWSDNPLKAREADSPLSRSAVLRGLHEKMRDARSRIALISAYFVPGEQGTRSLAEAQKRGVEIGIITNSLAANDVAAVHGGYAKYRKNLLEAGVELWELKPDPLQKPGRTTLFGSSSASLHTKAALIDDDTIFVGSFNLDPRSVSLNCEQGVLVSHPELHAELLRTFERLRQGERAYQVRLDADHRLSWSDHEKTLHREPEAGFMKRALAMLMRLSPFESQL